MLNAFLSLYLGVDTSCCGSYTVWLDRLLRGEDGGHQQLQLDPKQFSYPLTQDSMESL